jgi:hypothetical protein
MTQAYNWVSMAQLRFSAPLAHQMEQFAEIMRTKGEWEKQTGKALVTEEQATHTHTSRYETSPLPLLIRHNETTAVSLSLSRSLSLDYTFPGRGQYF